MAKPKSKLKPKRRRAVVLRHSPPRKSRNIEPAWEEPPPPRGPSGITLAIEALREIQASVAANPTGNFNPASLEPIIAMLTKAAGK